MWRATTVQACGLWPFSAGSGAPMSGVPIGQHLFTGATVCGDPLSWFTRARYISNPSLFMLGMPGLGKSTLINRMAVGLPPPAWCRWSSATSSRTTPTRSARSAAR
ncbi:hypothetical protein NKG94_02760 [Micromonospora sp. M12]